MKENNSIMLKFITKDGKILDVEKVITSDLYIIREYKIDVLDYNNLQFYADYKLELKDCINGIIPDNVMSSIILSKIPNELLQSVFSLEVIFESDEKTIKYFAEEKACGMGVVIVRLYKKRESLSVKSAKKSNWSLKGDILPIGMTQHEFDKLKEHFKIY